MSRGGTIAIPLALAGGQAGTVLAKKRMYLSGLQFKVYRFQRRRAEERFPDFFESKQ